jgi:DNA-binding CsgD family transcriptional regulator
MSEMTNSELLSPHDCRGIFRLIHELCELGNDPVQWNTHLLQTLGAMLDAPIGLACTFLTSTDPSSVHQPMMVHHRMDDVFKDYIDAADYRDNPETPGVIQRFGTDWTCVRRKLIDDETWYASPFYARICTVSGTDDHILSQVCIQSLQRIHHVAMVRPPGAAYFGEKEVAMVRFLHQELAHLWRKPEAVEIDTLAKRLLETVNAMRRGLSRKEIADELTISPHTVHTYERQLFDKFKVKSRGELLARLAKVIRPALNR